MSHKPLVLFAEDDHEDWILIQDALDNCTGEIHYERTEDGVAFLERLQDTTKQTPDLAFLDLQMPKMGGAQTLEIIRSTTGFRHLPIIIMTTSRLEADIFNAYHKGANSYLVKPVTFESMRDILGKTHDYWMNVATLPPTKIPVTCG